MAKQSKNAGFQQAAGLIRYFDAEEESAIKLPPVSILVFGVLAGAAVILMKVFWKF